MPTDKPKPLAAYPIAFHAALRRLIEGGSIAEPFTFELELSKREQVLGLRRRWRAFLRVARTSSQYAPRLTRLQLSSRIIDLGQGYASFRITAQPKPLDVDLKNYL